MDKQRIARVPETVKWLEEEIERSARLFPEDIERARQEAERERNERRKMARLAGTKGRDRNV